MKKVLYFYPHKFSGFTDGIHLRIVTILQYFKSRGFSVDMIHFDNPEVKGSYLLENGLVSNLFLLSGNPLTESGRKELSGVRKFLYFKWNGLKYRLSKWTGADARKKIRLPDLMTRTLSEKVEELVSKNNYEAVLVTYSYWSDIVKHLGTRFPQMKKVIDPTDFLTLQQFYTHPELGFSGVGQLFGDELERVGCFDEVIHISYDELLLFSNFLPGKKHHFIPQFFEKPDFVRQTNSRYDILLIASRNPYNIEGVNWFLKEVYPLLNKQISIAIAGNICSQIEFGAPNITKLGFVDDVRELYASSRCTICPIKRGSGMKIKVIESLSYGLPVVTTLKGMDGFINKQLDGGVMVADQPEIFAGYLNSVKEDPLFYAQQCKQALQLFETYFSADINFKKLDGVFGKTGTEN